MSPEVKFCRNVVACAGTFIFLVGILMVITNPTKWSDGLGMFSGAFMCLTIVREVNRKEGEWHKEIRFKEQHTQPKPSSDLSNDEGGS